MAPVVIVTGGGRGIGAATALALARGGWSVCLSYRQDGDAARSVVEACEAQGVAACAVRAEMADEDDVAALFAGADGLGPLGGLVNNAGMVGSPARVDELSRHRLDTMFAVNVIGPFLCAAHAVRRMSTAHGGLGGSIVNVSSAAARLGSPGEYVDYAASKGALDTMTLGLAKEVAAEGIRVNAVRPGLIHTDIHARGGQPGRMEMLQASVPMGRGGQPEEVADAIAWLCSDEASYVTGALLDIAGGR